MKREYEALSRLIGRNFAVLDDGTSVHLTPEGEIRDADGKMLLPKSEGRAELFRKNGKSVAVDEPKNNQNYVTDATGKACWNNNPIVSRMVQVEHHGDFSKGQTDSPGTAGTTFLNGIFRYTKVSDLVPSMEQLFADDTTIQLYKPTTMEPLSQPNDTKYVFEGAYGRWAMTLYPYPMPDTPDGYLPYVLVVTESFKIGKGSFNCYEPGIYMCAGSIGKKAGFPVLTYRDSIELTYPLPGEFITGLPDGNAPHRMLVTDADGNVKWEDRTHYSTGGLEEYWPEITFTAAEVTDDGYILMQEYNALVAGETYQVTYNGTAYECVAFDVPAGDGGATAPAIGNASAMGGEDSGEPFIIMQVPADMAAAMGAYGVIFPMDGAETITIQLYQNGTVYHRIPKEYLSGKPVTLTLAADGSFVADTDFETVYERDVDDIARVLVAVSPAGVNLPGAMDIDAASYYAVNSVSKGVWINAKYIRCEIDTYAALDDGASLSAIKLELTWIEVHGREGSWRRLPQMPYLDSVSDKNSTLYYDTRYGCFAATNKHTVDSAGNGWFAGTVEGAALILQSPDESRWQITVDDSGTLTAAKL